MDLFGFVKDIGRRVFNKDEEAAEKIKELIEKNNPGVHDLEVYYDTGGQVTLCGECDSPEALEKAVLIAGNVQGVADVHAARLKVKPQPAPAAEASAAEAPAAAPAEQVAQAAGTETPATEAAQAKVEYYVIQSGDTLSGLAKKYYGNAMDYPRIFEANKEVIEDPDRIFVGQKIRIPLD